MRCNSRSIQTCNSRSSAEIAARRFFGFGASVCVATTLLLTASGAAAQSLSAPATPALNIESKPAASGGTVTTPLPLANAADPAHFEEAMLAARIGRRALNGIVAGMPARVYGPPARANRQIPPNPTAVLVVGGAEGGLISADLNCPTLSRSGFYCAGVQYHDGWSGPTRLTNIPIEKIFEAVIWLGERKGIRSVVIIGEGRGGEAAILTGLAAARAGRAKPPTPHKLAGIVTFSGSAYSHPGIGSDPNVAVPAWQFGAVTIPSLGLYKMPRYSPDNLLKAIDSAPRDEVTAAELPIEALQTPLLVFGAQADLVWPSGEFAKRIEARAKAHDRQASVTVFVYPNAGHRLFGTGASSPSETYKWDGGSHTAHYGGTEAGNLAARTAAWDELLKFLGRFGTPDAAISSTTQLPATAAPPQRTP